MDWYKRWSLFKTKFIKELKIYASDIDERSIEIAKENSEKAGVEDDISFEVKDFKNIEKSC